LTSPVLINRSLPGTALARFAARGGDSCGQRPDPGRWRESDFLT
jgi:hypothetical protein